MDDVEVVAASARYRRWWLATVVFLVALAPFGVLTSEGARRWLAVLLVVAAAAILVEKWERLSLTDAGVRLRRWPRDRTVAWDDIAAIRIDWSGRAGGMQAAPAIELRDGEVVRSGVLSGVTARFGRGAERDAVLARVRGEAATHGFDVEVVGWQVT